MADMACPYCGSEQEVCHDDGAGYAEDETHQHTCSSCGHIEHLFGDAPSAADPGRAPGGTGGPRAAR